MSTLLGVITQGASTHKPIDAREEPHGHGGRQGGEKTVSMIDRLAGLAGDTPWEFPGEGGRWSRRHADDISLPGADHGGKIPGARPNPQEARKFVPTSGRRETGETA